MKRLQQLRLDAGLSTRDLAAKAGVAYGSVLDLESGTTTNPQVATLVKLATELKCKPSELLMDALPPMHTEEPKVA